jgi:UDP-2,3-diacylglucosamine hydrolase
VPPTLFLSDLHLSPERPALLAAFRAFCEGPARAAAGVYVLGDLFDAWVGDDQLREPAAHQVAGALRSLTAAGVPVGFVCGNRDFLVGERFAFESGVTLLPAQVVIGVAGVETLILHGDELCTGDASYQRWRRFARDPRWQRRFLALPYRARRPLAGAMRRRSRAATAQKAEAVTDVDLGAVAAAFREHGVARMIHGHTHRPARHHLLVDGRECERFVLADWYAHGSYLEFGTDGARTRDVPVPR